MFDPSIIPQFCCYRKFFTGSQPWNNIDREIGVCSFMISVLCSGTLKIQWFYHLHCSERKPNALSSAFLLCSSFLLFISMLSVASTGFSVDLFIFFYVFCIVHKRVPYKSVNGLHGTPSFLGTNYLQISEMFSPIKMKGKL